MAGRKEYSDRKSIIPGAPERLLLLLNPARTPHAATALLLFYIAILLLTSVFELYCHIY